MCGRVGVYVCVGVYVPGCGKGGGSMSRLMLGRRVTLADSATHVCVFFMRVHWHSLVCL